MKSETANLLRECVKAISKAAVAMRIGQPTHYNSNYYATLIQELQNPHSIPSSEPVIKAISTLQDIMIWFQQNPDKIVLDQDEAPARGESLTASGDYISEADLARNNSWIEVMTELGNLIKDDLN
jgi:hypothetical protein